MEVSYDTVQRLTIRPEKGLPIWVFLEGCGPERGRLTIICDGDVWSYYWGAMGKSTPTLETFLPKCNPDYIAKKLDLQIHKTMDDMDNLVEEARKEVIRRRREGDIDKSEARMLYDEAQTLGEGEEGYESIMYDIFGDDWWSCFPQKPNPEYEYLVNIIKMVQEALKLEEVTA